MLKKVETIKFKIKGLSVPEIFETKEVVINTLMVSSVEAFGTWANFGSISQVTLSNGSTYYVKYTIDQIINTINT